MSWLIHLDTQVQQLLIKSQSIIDKFVKDWLTFKDPKIFNKERLKKFNSPLGEDGLPLLNFCNNDRLKSLHLTLRLFENNLSRNCKGGY